MPEFTECPQCQSNNLVRITGDAERTIHYGRLSCSDCGRWICWLRDPSTTITTLQRQQAIDTLLQYRHQLTDWEFKFVRSIYKSRYLTPKQRDKLNAIGLRILKIRICLDESPSKEHKTRVA